MSWYFLDTSALVKRYHLEQGSECIHSLFDDPSHERVTSRLALVEMQSVIMRRLRLAEIDLTTVRKVRGHLLEEIRNRRIKVLAVRSHHFRLAGRVLMEYGQQTPVRTLDAIQMACAQDLRDRNYADILVTSDKHLLKLALANSFAVLNPEDNRSSDATT